MMNMTLRKSLFLVTLAGCAVDPADPDPAIEQIDEIEELDVNSDSNQANEPSPAGPVGSLFDMQLNASRTPLASVINGTGVASIAETQFVATSPLPTTLSISFTAPKLKFASAIVDDFVAIGPGRKAFSCGGPERECEMQAPSDPVDIKASGALSATWSTYVIDDATGQVICSGGENLQCPLAGTANPHAYRIVAGVAGLTELGPDAMETLLLGGKAFIGARGETVDVCTSQRLITGAQGVRYYQCMTSTRYARFQALETAQLEVAPATLEVAATAGRAFVERSSSVTSAMTWDAGTADLPARE